MSISTHQIQSVINAYGAQAVYKAAIKQMEGDALAFSDMGLVPNTMGCVYRVLSTAYAQMGDAAKAIDYAQTQALLDEIANRKT